MNAVEIVDALSELATQPFDAREFPFAFLRAFGNKATTIDRLRAGSSNASDIPGAVLQRNHIHMAVCVAGNVGETLAALKASPRTAKGKVKFILATDGSLLEAEELGTGEPLACEHRQLGDKAGFFFPLAVDDLAPFGDGRQRRLALKHVDGAALNVCVVGDAGEQRAGIGVCDAAAGLVLVQRTLERAQPQVALHAVVVDSAQAAVGTVIVRDELLARLDVEVPDRFGRTVHPRVVPGATPW